MSTNPRSWRGPILDDATNAGSQFLGVAAPTAQDDYFVVWRDDNNFHSGRPTIVARHFDTAGNPLTGDVPLSPVKDDFGDPVFASGLAAATPLPLPGGQADGLAVAFTNDFNGLGTDFDIYLLRTNANLVPLETHLVIDNLGKVTRDPSITSFSDGSLVVAYTFQNNSTDWDIVANIVSPTGTVGASFPLFDDTDRTEFVDLATLANGNFVAVFDSENFGNNSDHDVFFEIRTSAGGNVVSPTPVQGGADAGVLEALPRVAALKGGGFVVTWGDAQGDSGGGIGGGIGNRATLYDGSGNVVKGDFLVNTVGQTGSQRVPNVTAASDGGFVVVWLDDAAGYEIGQRFDAAGNSIGTPFSLPVDLASSFPDAATLPDGRFIFTSSAFPTNHDVVSWIYSTQSQHLDFNGDFTSDLLWDNGAQGALGIWQMQNGTIAQTAALNHDMPGWNAVAGDFNGDGTADLLWNNGAAGALGIWKMQNGAILVTTALNHDMPGWRALAGDFNGDGTDDLLWNNGAAGALGVWDMKDASILHTTALNHDMPGWMAAVGDFNGDGTDDLIWDNGLGGVLGVWQMKDGNISQTIALNHDMPGWMLAATGDLNHDGTTDLLWMNASGVLGVWLMHNGSILQTIAVNHDMPGWMVVS